MTVMLAFPHPGTVRTEFMMSVVSEAQDPASPVGQIYAHGTGPGLSEARSAIAEKFLASSMEWLWMVDADMVFNGRTLPALIERADPEDAPIISAICHGRGKDGELFPCVYSSGRDEQNRFRLAPVDPLPRGPVLQVAACGTGCVLIHRNAFKRISGALKDADGLWFAEMVIDGAIFGEDMSFSLRAAMAEVPVLAHTGVRVGHIKATMLGGVSP